MKLIQLIKDTRYGEQLSITLLHTKSYSFLQLALSWDDAPSWPYLQLTSGYGRVLGLLCSVHRFSFDIELLARTWYKDDSFPQDRE